VVDTIAIDTRTVVDQFETPHTDGLHTVERFHMTNGGMTLEANRHVEDSGAFTTPGMRFSAIARVEPVVADVTEPFNALSSTSAAGPILESSCAENPKALFGAGALLIPRDGQTRFLKDGTDAFRSLDPGAKIIRPYSGFCAGK
jgi:hypothetical protein